MPLDRRRFLLGSLAAGLLPLVPGAFAGSAKTRIKAVALDAFAVFDPRPVFALAERLFPGQGAALGEAWRTRQFEYTWLRVSAHRYKDFWEVTGEALDFAAEKSGIVLSPANRDLLLKAYLELKTWPDAVPALATLRQSGLRLGLLSNLTSSMLEANIGSAGLGGTFEQVLSTDRAKTYKPDPGAYRLGPEAFGLRKEEILFVAFAGWDAAGAKLFGYPTFWANRQHLPAERLDAVPDGTGDSLADVVRFLS
jgi:2-haloacid dehalogenase